MDHNNSVPSLWPQQITFSSSVCDYGSPLVALRAAAVRVSAGKAIWAGVRLCVASFYSVSCALVL